MSQEKLLTVRDVSIFLGISEKAVLDLAENGSLPGYKVGGVYLRFKREQVEEFKRTSRSSHLRSREEKHSFQERLKDFLYFNDFYILSFVLIVLLIIIIFQGY